MTEVFDKLLLNLDNVVDPSIPAWATVIIQSMKALIEQLKFINEKIVKVSALESLVAVNTKVSITLRDENKRLNG